MNKHFPPTEPLKIYYRKGKKHNTAQYITLDASHQEYLRWCYSMFYGHVKEFKNASDTQTEFYKQFFFCDQPDLPRPTRGKKGAYNTYATFLEGLEDNFVKTGTRDFTVKQLPHVVQICNMAYNYFTDMYPDFEPNTSIYRVNMVAFSKTDEVPALAK
jgi:hypothetical protein